MLISVAGNVLATDHYHLVSGGPGLVWLPWFIWGGGTLATKYGYDTTKHFGYLGTVGVPFRGKNRIVKSLRFRGGALGQISGTEGAYIRATLFQQSGNVASPLATVVLDRRTVPDATVGDPHFDIVQSAGDYVVSAPTHTLSIELLGLGQGIATSYGFCVELA
ncbi:MAG TPA: hypothetical protein VKA21_13700 [Candidatus Binatia bacterium]|nr:hypothetical protein [Candidatus Binatia bacterium]